jgi:hypothetical protein
MAVWRDNDAAWFEERMLHCALCGRMIARRFLEETFDHGRQLFCGEACRELYRDYWLVVRGPDYRPPADIGATYDALMVK